LRFGGAKLGGTVKISLSRAGVQISYGCRRGTCGAELELGIRDARDTIRIASIAGCPAAHDTHSQEDQ